MTLQIFGRIFRGELSSSVLNFEGADHQAETNRLNTEMHQINLRTIQLIAEHKAEMGQLIEQHKAEIRTTRLLSGSLCGAVGVVGGGAAVIFYPSVKQIVKNLFNLGGD